MAVVAKLCLVCKKYIPEVDYVEHFKACRKKSLGLTNINVNTKSPQVVNPVPVKKDCGCNKKK